MKSKHDNLAIHIIENNEYLTLATVDDNGKPWTCILAYTFDENYSFYYISLPSSNHSRHIKNNQTVAFTIYDSHQDFGCGIGLQFEGIVKEVRSDEKLTAINLYFGRKYPYGSINNTFMDGVKEMIDKDIYRFYRIDITSCWMNDPDAETDRRVQIELNG